MAPQKFDNKGQRESDALYIFESLFSVTTPVVINVNEISSQTGVKPNTIIKRFSNLRQRYPGLKVQTTAVAPTTGSPARPVPATPGPRNIRTHTVPKTSVKSVIPKNVKSRVPAKVIKDEDTDDDPLQDDVEDDDTGHNDGETADDEATPIRPIQLKKKRTISSVSTIARNIPNSKKRKVVSNQNNTASDDELMLSGADNESANTFLKAREQDINKSKLPNQGTKLPSDGPPKLYAPDATRFEVSERTNPLPLTINLAAIERSPLASLPTPDDSPMPLPLAGSPDPMVEDSEYMLGDEETDSVAAPRFIFDTDALPLQQTVSRSDSTIANQDHPSLLAHQTTLLRDNSIHENGNRIVGVDVGFDNVIKAAKKPSN